MSTRARQPDASPPDQPNAPHDHRIPPGDRAVSIIGDVVDSTIITGDDNVVYTTSVHVADEECVELSLSIERTDAEHFAVTASAPGEQRLVSTTMRRPFSILETQSALAALGRGRLNTEARVYGARLFELLMPPPVAQLYARCRDRQLPVRLRLVLGDPELHAYPWELLYDAEHLTWLIQAGPIVRESPVDLPPRAPGPVHVPAPFRVLVADVQHAQETVSPIDTGALEHALGDMREDRLLSITCARPRSMAELERAMAAAAGPGGELDMVHVITSVPLTPAHGGRLSPSALGEAARGLGVQLVAISVPDSADTCEAECLAQAGPTLLRQGLAGILGVPLSGAADEDAQTFRKLYLSLGAGKSVDLAILDADRRRASDRPSGIPICYLAPGEPLRFEVQTPAPSRLTRATWRTWASERISVRRVLAGVIPLIGVITAIGPPLWTWLLPAPLPVMGGSLNIAVVEFAQINPNGARDRWDRGEELARQFAIELDMRRAALDLAVSETAGRAEIHGPEATRPIQGASVEAREQSAQALANAIEADLIVSGHVLAGGRRFVPEIFVSSRKGLNAVDPGFYNFGQIHLRDDANLLHSLDDQRQLRDRLTVSTESVTQFALGVNAHVAHNYGVAREHFAEAARLANVSSDTASSTLAGETEGLEALLMLIGDVELKQAASIPPPPAATKLALLESAQARYAGALTVDPEFARAWIGLAETQYLRSVGSCPRSTPSLDVDGLRESIALYRRALDARNQSPLANVPSKVHFGTGRAIFCMARANAEGASVLQARAELQRVVDAYQPGNEQLKDWALEAHATMGGMALLEEQHEDAARSFEAAIALSQIQTQREMGGESARRRLFCRSLGRAHARMQRISADGAGLPMVTAEPACQEQFREGYRQTQQGA